MSDTPRTDKYIGDGNEDNMTEGEIAICLFARTLERELAEKDREIVALQSQLNLALDALERGRK